MKFLKGIKGIAKKSIETKEKKPHSAVFTEYVTCTNFYKWV